MLACQPLDEGRPTTNACHFCDTGMRQRDNAGARQWDRAAAQQRARATTRQRGIAARQRDSAAARQTALQVCRLTSQHASTAVRAQSPHCNRGQPADWLWRQARRIAHRANRPRGTTNRAPPKTTASHFRRMRDGPTHFRTSRTSVHHRKSPITHSSTHHHARPLLTRQRVPHASQGMTTETASTSPHAPARVPHGLGAHSTVEIVVQHVRILTYSHTAWTKPRIHLAARDGDTCLHAAWTGRMPMSENVSMGPHCNDSGFICQKTPEWGLFSLRA